MLEEAVKHQSVTLVSEKNWLQLWEAASTKVPTGLTLHSHFIGYSQDLYSETEFGTSVTVSSQKISAVILNVT